MRSRILCSLMTGVALSCGVVLAQEELDWRAPWRSTLASRPSGVVPDVVILRLENRGSVTLVGENVVFNLYRGGSMYGWAIDPGLRKERLEIPPGQSIERTSRRQDWLFHDLQGVEVPRSKAERDLARGKWEIAATLTDMATPKPPYESSYLIWSTNVKFGGNDNE